MLFLLITQSNRLNTNSSNKNSAKKAAQVYLNILNKLYIFKIYNSNIIKYFDFISNKYKTKYIL